MFSNLHISNTKFIKLDSIVLLLFFTNMHIHTHHMYTCIYIYILYHTATGNHVNAVHYDIVGRLETRMNETLTLLLDRLGLNSSLYTHSTRNSNDAHKKVRLHYRAGTSDSKEIVSTVYQMFKNDIHDFGYSLEFDENTK
jgi:hypothetical protein